MTLNQRVGFSRFDRMVGVVIAVITAGIALTLLLGDRVGVTINRAGPLGTASSTARVSLMFSETMNRDSVAARFSLLHVDNGEAGEAVPGVVTWSGATAIFLPDEVLQPGGSYRVVLDSGAVSETGRQVLSTYQFEFTVKKPLVAYLAPASGSPLNVWVSDPEDPSTARQVTFSPSGIYDYAVSPDGGQIAFSERNSNTGTSDIKLLDLATNAIQQITNCVDSDCTTPTWRPDGRSIAYERVDFNSELTNIGVSPTRIWLIDLTVVPATTRPLFEDTQILGYGMQWSADGARVSVFDLSSQGILVHNLDGSLTALIPSRYGSAGAMSPDGRYVVYPEVLLTEGSARSYLNLVDLENMQDIVPLSAPDDPVDDDAAAWSPDSTQLVIARRYLDDRYTRGRQLYLYNLEDGEVKPLVVDERYANGFFAFDPTGTELVIQRFPELTAGGEPNSAGRPEIWTYNLESGLLRQVAVDAFLPRWVP